MKTPSGKRCRSQHFECFKMTGRRIITPLLPGRRGCPPATTNLSGSASGLAKVCGRLAVVCLLAGAGAFAVSAAPIRANDTGAGTTTAPAKPAASAPAAAASKAGPPSVTQNILVPAAPMNTSTLPLSVEEDIRDIRSPRHLPARWPWGAGAAGALALAAIAYAVWKRHVRKAASPQLPYEVALDRLERARRFMNPEQAREFCFAVSEVIRGYIEQRFRVRAPRRTTEEFLYDLLEEKHVMLTPQRTLLAEFLQHCDLAKFALWQFSVPEMEAMHLSARTFVLQTALEPASSGPAKKNEPALPKSPQIRLDPPVAAPRHATAKPA